MKTLISHKDFDKLASALAKALQASTSKSKWHDQNGEVEINEENVKRAIASLLSRAANKQMQVSFGGISLFVHKEPDGKLHGEFYAHMGDIRLPDWENFQRLSEAIE